MKRLTYRDEEGSPHWSKELMEDNTGWAGELIRSTVADMEDAAERPTVVKAWNCGICEVPTHWAEWGKLGYEYCPHCGRPLTDAAWEMLEKRLEGRK